MNIHEVTRDVIDKLSPVVEDYQPTGSRYFGDYSETSDYDIVIKVLNHHDMCRLVSLATDNGFKVSGGSGFSREKTTRNTWMRNKSYMFNNNLIDVNLIILTEHYEFWLWRYCTRVSKENSFEKEYRKEFFNQIINATNTHIKYLYEE